MGKSDSPLSPLPIDAHLAELTGALADGRNVLLRAPTGAGKTTRIPPAIDGHEALSGTVVMIEPRRIAARAAARRMAEEAGEKVGERIGYSVRFDDRTGKQTTIKVVTAGVFLRQIQADPFLTGVGVVVFDEFHERGIDADLALAMTRRVQTDAREDLRVVVMSATLQTESLAAYLGEPEIIESKGRLFPVTTHMLDTAERSERTGVDAALVSRYVRRAYDESDGDVLVFLPGIGEIKRCARSLRDWGERSECELFELYGDLPAKEQDAVFDTGPRRKIILATNIAETSLTLPRITAVVDTGLSRSLRYDAASGLDRLELGPISRSSARQRLGRAGRTEPGICWQLWTPHDEQSRPEDDRPEIERVDLATAALQLVAWGETNLQDFQWFAPPPKASLERAQALLERLGAIEGRSDGRWIATRVGKTLAALPLHPRLGRLLIAGAAMGVVREAAACAALLSERSPFQKSRDLAPHSRPRVSAQDSDILDELDALEAFERTGVRDFEIGTLSTPAARHILRVRDQIRRLAPKADKPRSAAEAPERDTAIPQALLQAFPDRLATRREGNESRALMVGGRGLQLARECGVRSAQLLLCLDLDGRPGESLLRRATAIDAAWLPPERVSTQLELRFDGKQARVEATRITRFEDLAISTTPAQPQRDDRCAATLAEAARKDLARALDLDAPAFASFTARAACLREWMPELELPGLGEKELGELLIELCVGRISFAELRKAPLLETYKSRFSWKQLQAVDEHAPERIEVPSGNTIALTYEPGRPPVLAARIQEMFGWSDTPRIASGRVGLLLHLLAPNMRPQQVTDDLRNFWDTTYAEVRKELRQRYPKHDWPEDPWTASPSRGARRRRRPG